MTIQRFQEVLMAGTCWHRLAALRDTRMHHLNEIWATLIFIKDGIATELTLEAEPAHLLNARLDHLHVLLTEFDLEFPLAELVKIREQRRVGVQGT